MSSNKNVRLGFIGGGNMAKAIIEGLLKTGIFRPEQLYISYPSCNQARKFQLPNETQSNELVVENCDVIIFCVKPQILDHVVESVRHLFNYDRHLFVSICAGIDLDRLKRIVSGGNEIQESKVRIARCTLNTAAIIGRTSAVFSQNGNLTDADKEIVTSLLNSVGTCNGEIKDSEMDAAMAVCACGIAYMYMMVDAMADAGVKMGLSRDLALKLSMQTMNGGSELMRHNFKTKHPMQLKDEVCSPGGTTIAGVHELERNGFRNSIICALEAATNRAKQLNNPKS
jgi:pyrroline-5-carboxylate reductase